MTVPAAMAVAKKTPWEQRMEDIDQVFWFVEERENGCEGRERKWGGKIKGRRWRPLN